MILTGYPGELQVNLKYYVSDTHVSYEFTAETKEETIVNLTNHSYFNLAGVDTDVKIDDNLIRLEAER